MLLWSGDVFFEFSTCLGIVFIVLLAALGAALGIYDYKAVSSAAELKEIFGEKYYVSVLLQNQADIFLWVAIVLIGIRKMEK